jgi:hypothetical protein
MIQKEITGKVLKDGVVVSAVAVFVNFGESTKESVEMFGDEAVNSNAFANWKITARSIIVRMLKAGKTEDEIQEVMSNAKMGVQTSTGSIDPIMASLAKFKTMSPDEQDDFQSLLEKIRDEAAE